MGGFSTSGSLFRHTVHKNNLNLTIYLLKKLFLSEFFFHTPNKHTFSNFGYISTLAGSFRQLYKTNGKYGVIVYLCTYQRLSYLFVKNFPKNMFDFDNKSKKTVKMSFIPQIKVDRRSLVK